MTIVFKHTDTQVALDDMLKSLTGKVQGTLSAIPGRKYIKLVVENYGSRSVYCFLDYKGNIYKAASWAAPAKHIRGSVFDHEYGWGRALGPYGAAYLR